MATGPGFNQGKSAFLEKFLPGHRDANLEAVNQAWSAAGNDGTISDSLFGKLRSKLGLTGRKVTNGGATQEKAAPPAKVKAKTPPKQTNGKATSKAEEAPSPSNGSQADTGPSKSAFVEEMFGREPRANVATVNKAWAAAGHEGTISDSIYYKVKRELGLTGESTAAVTSQSQEPEAGPALVVSMATLQLINVPETATASQGGDGSGASGGLGRVVDEVEAGIDELMFTLKVNGGMPEVEAALRAARRLLTRSQGE
jgi:hypothetical protein